jgi:hypothetical protein
MKIFSKKLDRRRCQRFAVVGKPLAVMKPGPDQPGRVTQISTEAVEISYITDGSKVADTDELDILVADFTRGLHLQWIPVQTISDCSSEECDHFVRKRIVAFGKLTGDQRRDLQSFIRAYAR